MHQALYFKSLAIINFLNIFYFNMHQFKKSITNIHLDRFQHVNNATYLTLLEEARWDLINLGGYGIEQIQKTGLGPVILEIRISFLKELLLGDEIIIETHLISYDKKIAKMSQNIMRNGVLCAKAELTFGLFDLQKRQLVLPTPAWLKAIGYQTSP